MVVGDLVIVKKVSLGENMSLFLMFCWNICRDIVMWLIFILGI